MIRVKKLKQLVEKQALMVALRELSTINSESEKALQSETIDSRFCQWLNEQLEDIKQKLLKDFVDLKKKCCTDLEGDKELRVGIESFEEVQRGLKLLMKQFMLEVENPDNLSLAQIAFGRNTNVYAAKN